MLPIKCYTGINPFFVATDIVVVVSGRLLCLFENNSIPQVTVGVSCVECSLQVQEWFVVMYRRASSTGTSVDSQFTYWRAS